MLTYWDTIFALNPTYKKLPKVLSTKGVRIRVAKFANHPIPIPYPSPYRALHSRTLCGNELRIIHRNELRMI